MNSIYKPGDTSGNIRSLQATFMNAVPKSMQPCFVDSMQHFGVQHLGMQDYSYQEFHINVFALTNYYWNCSYGTAT